MLIDWFTVGAQTLNFALLVWLMKRFLYRPILAAVDARESRIAAELGEAHTKKAEAQVERDEFFRKTETLERERGVLLQQAAAEAKAERRRLLEEALSAADAAAALRRETLKADARGLERSIRRRAQEEVFAIARQVLADLASASLEERLSDVFVRRLGQLDELAKSKLAAALASSTDPALVRSAFELSAEQHVAIKAAVDRTFAADVDVRFETTPELISGIEFSTKGQKVAWSIADYLALLEQRVGEFWNEHAESQAQQRSEREPAMGVR